MKKLAIAVGLVFAFSSAAFAINFTGNSIQIDGVNSYGNGKVKTSTFTETRTLKLSASGTGWKALAEYSGSSPVFDDWYISTKEKPFTLELWGRGEDQNNDYETPFEWVSHDDVAPTSNWASRLTTTIGGNETVFATMNSATPEYYAFYKQPVAVGQSTNVGAAYKTTFNHNNTLYVWASTKVGTVTITGEAAAVSTYNATEKKDKSDSKIGVKGVWDNGLTLKSYVDKPAKVQYLEATMEPTVGTSRYQGIYQVTDSTTKKTTADVRIRASKDQAIADIWNVDNDWFDLNDAADNDWLKNKQYAYGANLVTDNVNAKNSYTLKLYGNYVQSDSLKGLAIVTMSKPADKTLLTTAELRGWYQSPGDKNLTIHPRAFFTGTSTKVGVVGVYKISIGQVEAAVWNEQAKVKGSEPINTIDLGYQLVF